VGEDGHLRLVDFELAYEVGHGPAEGKGTQGYFSPQQEAGETPSVADDIYGLGAVLYFVAGGAEPSLAPRTLHLLDRPLDLLNPDVHPGLVRLVERCLDPDPQRRFHSMAAIESAVREIEKETHAAVHMPARPPLAADDEQHYRQLAEGLAETLCRMVKRTPGDDRLFWLSTHENREGISARDLSIGSAGPVLALAELVSVIPNKDHRDVLARAAHSLAATRHSSPDPLPGLYVGEAGVGAALLRAGKVLDDDSLIASAMDQGRRIASIPYASQDMFNGTAGRLRFHLWLYDATSDPEQLRNAKHAGTELLRSAEGSEESGIWWTIPPGYGGLSGSAYIGYAHGAAGIADALLDLFESSGDEQFLAAARGAGRWIAQHAVPTLAGESGLDWPDVPGGTSIGPFWCHGSAGVGQFFLHAAQLGMMPGAEDLALRAANAAAKGARWSGPTQCHGLAGNIEFLLDVYQATRDCGYLDEARVLGRLLRTFSFMSSGLLVWPSESQTIVTPDYTVGYAGVAACLLRLSAPAQLPRQLSRRGFART
jgi:lantibiotic modifying enzyme